MGRNKLEEQFVELIPRLGLELYLGVSALLCADATNFNDNLDQVLTNFKKLPRNSQRDLVRTMRAAIKQQEAEADGSSTNA